MSKMASHKAFGHQQHKLWSKEGSEVKLPIWLPTTKCRESTHPGVCRLSATHCWKALKESYKFASDLVSIRGQNKKLQTPKVPRVQTETVSGLHFGSPRKKCHSNASAAESHREYYMGEGGGFPRVWAVVSQMNPRLPVACPSTKGALECRLEWVNSLSLFLVQSQSFSTPPYPF